MKSEAPQSKEPRRTAGPAILAAALIVCALPCAAQSYQLTPPQRVRLLALIGSDESAKAAIEPLRRLATASLAESPHPIAVIRSEGLLASDPKKIATRKALQDMDRLYALAAVWQLDRRDQALAKARDYLVAWASVNRSRGDPIDDTNLESALRAYDFVREGLDASDRARIEAWFSQVADAEITSFTDHPGRSTDFSNWNSHRLKIVGLVAFATGRARYLNFVLTQFPKQIERNLLPDGSSYDFHERDALHYHIYTLLPLVSLCAAMKQNGYTLFATTVGGRSIAHSIEFALPYIQGLATHAEFVHSKGGFDRKRSVAGERGFIAGMPFDPLDGLPLLEAAYYFEPELLPTIQRLSGRNVPFPSWQVLLESVQRD
ncbi:MAG TPA: alginate lyase family protein [Rectinemataceae bacterium]|nr:alginate lyase family protein [Rectinemataceae bacterium]